MTPLFSRVMNVPLRGRTSCGLSWERGLGMVRRFGILGVSALLTASLTAGCVTTGAPPLQRVDDPVALQPPPQPRPAPALVLPSVTVEFPTERSPRVEGPAPPPPPKQEIQPVKLQPEPPALPARIANAPAELNEPPILSAMRLRPRPASFRGFRGAGKIRRAHARRPPSDAAAGGLCFGRRTRQGVAA